MDSGRALVVGASSQIGTAIALMLAREGYDLILWGRDTARLHIAARAVEAVGVDCQTGVVELSDLDHLLQRAEEVQGEGRLGAVVYAAGLFDFAPVDEADPVVWERLLHVNLTAAAVLTACLSPALVQGAPSALVYIGSGAARRAYAGNAAYVASKHGLAGLAEGTFLDLRDRGVKVSLVSPGLVAAGAGLLSPGARARLEQLLTPDDVAQAVRFVVTFPARGCPVEIDLQPQRSPG